ncbi:AbrB/MazE/SpoVT family DNA-binding domain-containing protein [Fusobacterium necrophorum subsp. funduliforme]
MEKYMRILKIIFANDGKGRVSPKLSIPKNWLDNMRIDSENREVEVHFDEQKKEITIKKRGDL